MNLKPIAASIILLGLSAPAFADYSGAGDAMNAQLNKMQAVVNQNSAGNYGTAAPGSDWANRITVSGQMNVNAAYGNRSPNLDLASATGGSVSNLSLNNANLFIDAQVSQWTKAHVSLEASSNVSSDFNQNKLLNGSSVSNNSFFVDEAYATIGDLSQMPVYVKAGKEYVPFGVYDRNPIVFMPTQMLSETSNTAAQVGFVMPMGLYGSIYGIDGVQTANDVGSLKHNVRSGGADLGFATSSDTWGMLLDAGWIQNIENANALAAFASGGYNAAASGVALSANANFMGVDGKLRYVAALQQPSFAAGVFNGIAFPAVTSSKPRAAGAELGYSFPVVNHNTRLAAGWQHTSGTDTLLTMPRNMYYANYTFNMSRDTNLGLEVYNSRGNVSSTLGGSSQNATVGVVQLGVNLT